MGYRKQGGLYMASNVSRSTRIWDCALRPPEKIVGIHGDVEHLRDDVGGRGEEEEDDEEEDVYEEGLEEEEAVRVVQVLPIDILRRRGEPHCPAASTGNDCGFGNGPWNQ